MNTEDTYKIKYTIDQNDEFYIIINGKIQPFHSFHVLKNDDFFLTFFTKFIYTYASEIEKQNLPENFHTEENELVFTILSNKDSINHLYEDWYEYTKNEEYVHKSGYTILKDLFWRCLNKQVYFIFDKSILSSHPIQLLSNLNTGLFGYTIIHQEQIDNGNYIGKLLPGEIITSKSSNKKYRVIGKSRISGFYVKKI